MDIVEGWTGRIEWQAKKDGVVVDLSGVESCFSLRDKHGASISMTCTDATEVITATCGYVGLNPSTGTFLEDGSPYSLRLKVVDSTPTTVYFPSGTAESIIVRSA